MRIVIVEDEIALVKVLGEKFKREGFDVSVATNGEDAVRVIRSQEPTSCSWTSFFQKRTALRCFKK